MPTLEKSLGRYQLLQEIRRTPDWVLYEAYDPTQKRLAAVWELALPDQVSPGERQERVARFRDETARFSGFTHPNLPAVFEVGPDPFHPFLSMEFLDGQSLRRALQARRALPPKQALEVAIQTCSALAAIHGHGLVHRAVKPDNIILLGDGTVKLTGLDFGRLPGVPTLSPYHAPETVQGVMDARSDLYALGVTLGEMLTGQKPLPGGKHPTEMPPGVSPAVRDTLRKSWSADPNARFASASEFAAALFTEIERLEPPPAPAPAAPPAPEAPRPAPAPNPVNEARAAAYRDMMTQLVTKATEEVVSSEVREKKKKAPKWAPYLPWVVLCASLIALGCLLHIALQPGPDPMADVKKKQKLKEMQMKKSGQKRRYHYD